MSPKELLINSIIYAIVILLICPLGGALINKILTTFISAICRVFDRTGNLFLCVANTITFMGVVFHELSHAFIAFILGAKIRKINLYKKTGNRLGSVMYSPKGPAILRSLQMSLSAAAPVFMGAIAQIYIFYILQNMHMPIWACLILYYLSFSIALHMDMSAEDIGVYLKGIPICLLLIVIIMAIVGYFFDLPILTHYIKHYL